MQCGNSYLADSFPQCEHTPIRNLRESRRRRGVPVPPVRPDTVSKQRSRVQCGNSYLARQLSPLRAHTEPPHAWFQKEARRPSASRSPNARFRSNLHQSSAATAPQPDNFSRCEHTPNCHLRESRRRRGVPVPPVRPRHTFGATFTIPVRQQLPSPTSFPNASTHRTATSVNPEGVKASQCLPFAQCTVSEQRAPVQCGNSYPARQLVPLQAHTELPPV
jgi:hypothetical protein